MKQFKFYHAPMKVGGLDEPILTIEAHKIKDVTGKYEGGFADIVLLDASDDIVAIVPRGFIVMAEDKAQR